MPFEGQRGGELTRQIAAGNEVGDVGVGNQSEPVLHDGAHQGCIETAAPRASVGHGTR